MSTDSSPTDVPALSAYELLNLPTLEMTDAQVESVIVQLREKRDGFLAGVKDNPRKTAKAKAAGKPTAEEKAAQTAALLDGLDLGDLTA